MAMEIISMNANGLETHWFKIKNLLKRDTNWNIICIQETHRFDMNKVSKWAEQNEFLYYSNHVNVGQNWTDTEQKKKLYYRGSGIFIIKEMETKFEIHHRIVREDRVQALSLTDKETKEDTTI